MARPRPPDGLQRLLDAGLTVFARKGLEATRMSDVADEMKVATGTLYGYVDGKEALFYLLVDHGLRTTPLELPAKLPIRAPSQARLLARLLEQVVENYRLPAFEAAVVAPPPADARAELSTLCEELFDFTHRTRLWVDVIERSATDIPKIRTFFAPLRRAFFEQLTSYVRSRVASGAFRDDVDAAVAARVLVETITFFARHRHGDPDPTPMDDLDVRATTIRLLVRSLMKG